MCELDGSDGDIGWQVELANHKPAWYYFDQALDISPGSRNIGGISTNVEGGDPQYSFDTGDVYWHAGVSGRIEDG